jgi:toluene monooxygenase system protein E
VKRVSRVETFNQRVRLKTYSHLADARRLPTAYEVASSRLLYHPARGLEVDLPLGHWFQTYAAGSPLRSADWERFADPRETTYTSYTQLARDKEVFVDRILQSIEERGYDGALDAPWVDRLEEVLGVARYPWHAFQMIIAYVGHLAPSGRIAIVTLFQAADEMRRIQRVAYRLAQLGRARPGFGAGARARWEGAPAWQPLRRLVEQLLTTYDFGEALCGLNLCAKPLCDSLLVDAFAEQARRAGDPLLGEILFSLAEDCRWQRAWTAALVRLVAPEGENRRVIAGWLGKWQPPAEEALRAAAPAVLVASDDVTPLVGEHAAWLGELELAT